MALFGDQVSVTTSAQSLTTLLSLTAATRKYLRQLKLRIDPASGNTIYWGASDVTNVPANAMGALVAATTPTADFGTGDVKTFSTDELFLVATTGTTVCFVTAIE